MAWRGLQRRLHAVHGAGRCPCRGPGVGAGAGAAALPEVTVRAPAEAARGLASDADIARRSAAGTKTDAPVIETPQSISVVGRQQLEDQQPRAVPEALHYTPGAFTGLVGASNRYDYMALRGFKDSSVDSTLLDGLRLLSDQGSYTSMQVDPYFLDRIDVVRGPASVLYGRASPGGLVALTSLAPQFESRREVQLTLGNRHRLEGAVDLAGPVGDDGAAAFRVTALARRLASQVAHVEEQRQAVAPSLLIKPSQDTRLVLQAYLQDDPEGSYHSGVPADASLGAGHNGRRISRSFFGGEPGVEQFHRVQRFAGYQFAHAFNAGWNFRQNFRYVSADTSLRQVYGYGWAGTDTLRRYYVGARESTHGYTVDNQLEGRFETGAFTHTLLLGLDYQRRRVAGTWDAGSALPINVSAPAYGAAGLGDLGSDPIDRRLAQTGLYLQDQVARGRWQFTLGGREDRASASNRYGDGAPAQWRGAKFTRRAGAVYLFDNGVVPYAGYAEGFNPSLRNDRQGRILPPAESRQVEVGVRFQPQVERAPLAAHGRLSRAQGATAAKALDHHRRQRPERRRGLPRPAAGGRCAPLQPDLAHACAALLPDGNHQAHAGNVLARLPGLLLRPRRRQEGAHRAHAKLSLEGHQCEPARPDLRPARRAPRARVAAHAACSPGTWACMCSSGLPRCAFPDSRAPCSRR